MSDLKVGQFRRNSFGGLSVYQVVAIDGDRVTWRDANGEYIDDIGDFDGDMPADENAEDAQALAEAARLNQERAILFRVAKAASDFRSHVDGYWESECSERLMAELEALDAIRGKS